MRESFGKFLGRTKRPRDISKSPSPCPLPDRTGPAKTGEGEIPGGRVCVPNAATIWMPQFTKPLRGTWSQGSSFLATAGLICETRLGVFKMARRGREWWAKVEGIVRQLAQWDCEIVLRGIVLLGQVVQLDVVEVELIYGGLQ